MAKRQRKTDLGKQWANESERLDYLQSHRPSVHEIDRAYLDSLCLLMGDSSEAVQALALERFEEARAASESLQEALEEYDLFDDMGLGEEATSVDMKKVEELYKLFTRCFGRRWFALLEKLCLSPSCDVRSRAAALLGKTAHWADLELHERIRDTLHRLWREPVEEVWRGAALGLAVWDDDEGLRAIREQMRASVKEHRLSAFFILASKLDDSLGSIPIELILEALESEDKELQKKAISVIGFYDHVDERLIQPMLRIFLHHDTEHEEFVENALFSQGQRLLDLLGEALNEPLMDVRVRAASLLSLYNAFSLASHHVSIPHEVWVAAAKHPQSRIYAYPALAETPEGRDVLCEILLRSSDEGEISSILEALLDRDELEMSIFSTLRERLPHWPAFLRLSALSLFERLEEGAEQAEKESVWSDLFEMARYDENPEVRGTALDVLISLGAVDMASALVHEQLREGKLDVAGVRAFAQLFTASKEMIPYLRQFLMDETNWDLIDLSHAAVALGKTQDLSVVPILLEFLEARRQDYFSSFLADALEPLGEKVLPLLAETWCAKKPSPFVLEPIAMAFARIGTTESLGYLLEGSKHRLKGVRHAAAKGLQDWPGVIDSFSQRDRFRLEARAEVVKVFCERLKSERSKDVLQALIESIGSWGGAAQEAAPLLRKMLEQGNASELLRHVLFDALGRLGDVESVPALTQVLKGNEEDDIFEALGALKKIGLGARSAIPSVVAFIERGLVRLEEEQSEEMEEGFGYRETSWLDDDEDNDDEDNDEDFNDLDENLNDLNESLEELDEDEWFSWGTLVEESIDFLGICGAEEAIPLITRLLSLNGDDEPPTACLTALRRIRVSVPSLKPPFLTYLARADLEDSFEWGNVAELLGEWQVQGAEDAILRCLRLVLEDGDTDIAWQLLRGLRGVCGVASLPLLQQIFEQENEHELFWGGLRALSAFKGEDSADLERVFQAISTLRDKIETEDLSRSEESEEEDLAELADKVRFQFLAASVLSSKGRMEWGKEAYLFLREGLEQLTKDLENLWEESLFAYADFLDLSDKVELDRYLVLREVLEEIERGLVVLLEGLEQQGYPEEMEAAVVERELRDVLLRLKERLEAELASFLEVAQAPRSTLSRTLDVLARLETFILQGTLLAYRKQAEDVLFHE